MGLFGAAHEWGFKEVHLTKICPTMIKLGTVIPCLNKIKKHINHVIHSLSSADI